MIVRTVSKQELCDDKSPMTVSKQDLIDAKTSAVAVKILEFEFTSAQGQRLAIRL